MTCSGAQGDTHPDPSVKAISSQEVFLLENGIRVANSALQQGGQAASFSLSLLRWFKTPLGRDIQAANCSLASCSSGTRQALSKSHSTPEPSPDWPWMRWTRSRTLRGNRIRAEVIQEPRLDQRDGITAGTDHLSPCDLAQPGLFMAQKPHQTSAYSKTT